MIKFYRLDKILKLNALYNMIIGERSNGKSYAVKEYGIKHYIETGNPYAIIRRWEEDFKGKNGANSWFNDMYDNIKKWTNNKYNCVEYYSFNFYLANRNDKGELVEKDNEPFCIGFALSQEERYKSTSFPKIDIIVFEEFMTRKLYLQDEFIAFTNVLSTIIRLRDNVIIFMLGNTVNKYCPYFNEMGLNHIKDMTKGKIDLYTYGSTGLSVAVEYADFPTKEKKSNKYFAFDNPKLKMITGGDSGGWEIGVYPHLPYKFIPRNIVYTFFISFNGDIIQCEVINKNSDYFIYFHIKTTPIKENEKSLIYQTESNPRPNYRRKITKPVTTIEKRIIMLFNMGKVFYQNNEVGEIVRNYINWCLTND